MAESTENTSLTADTAVDAFESLLAAEDGDNQEDEKAEAGPDDSGDDAEPEEPEESEEAEAEDEDEDQPVFTVKIDGKEVKVKADELVAGYQRNADYTRKTQEVAEQRRSAAAELEQARAERAHYAQQLEAVSSLLQRTAPQQPDWDRLLAENPVEYLRQQRLHQQQQYQMRMVEAERQQVAARQQAEQVKTAEERLNTEADLMVKAIPEWKNPKIAAKEKTAMAEFAVKAGYGPDEIAQIDDHRAVTLLRKAFLYDQITAQRANLRPVPPKGPRAAQPGAPTQRSGNELSRAKQRLAKSGDVHDAAAVFEHFV